MSESQRVLIIEDNPGVCEALEVLLEVNGIEADSVHTPAEGLARAKAGEAALVIADMNFETDTTSGDEGMALFNAVREVDPDLPIILLTAWTHLEQAVSLVKAGAADYLAKPWDDERLINTVRNLLALKAANDEQRRARAEWSAVQDQLARQFDLRGAIYQSQKMHELLAVAARVARSDVPVLITGPNGAGKGKIAEIIQANSAVADGPFVTVNAGALPDDLLEAELFGVTVGAFTGADRSRQGRFATADGGTLFLDEVGNLSAAGQMKLLRVLQTGEFEPIGSSTTQHVKVRVISATNIDLNQAVADGRFREDLLYRLNVIALDVPPLAERTPDILPLAETFLAPDWRLSPEASDALMNHDWPGNVRELHNCLERAKLLASGTVIAAADLGLSPPKPRTEHEEVAEIRRALATHEGVVARAARSLNLTRQALYRRMEKYGIEPDS
ncbi:MAG: sigma-54-dependent transcriptional regulator [Wenzhouxiangellaceae bacterium]